MSGPIIRSGPSVKYSQNWESVFGTKKTKATAGKPAEKKAAPKKAKRK
jgi:hypothetical protein